MKVSTRDRLRLLELVEGTAAWLAGLVVFIARPDPGDPVPTWVAAIVATSVVAWGARRLLEGRIWPPRRTKRRPVAAIAGVLTAVVFLAIVVSLHLFVGSGPQPTPGEWLQDMLVGWVGLYAITFAMWAVPPAEAKESATRQTEIAAEDLPNLTASWRVGPRR